MTADAAGDGKGKQDWARFRQLLDEQNAWPAEYLFKFIVPSDRVEDVRRLFGQIPISIRESKRGRYMSVSATMLVHSSDEIEAVYRKAGEIPGLIAL